MTNRVWIVAKKDLKAYFDHPTAYVLLVVWLALASYFFFRAAFMIGEASVRPLFELLPWFMLFFVPAVTMRALAAEKKDGTLEVLLSHPISEVEVVVGKLIANVLFLAIALALTIPIPLGLSLGGRLDIGMIVGQYLGAVLLITGLSAVGLLASSLTRNQTVAFISALAIGFVLIISGLDFVLLAVPFPLTAVLRRMSVLSHFDSMARGVITLADISYFAALTGVFVAAGYFGLRRERESKKSGRYGSLRLGTVLIIIVCVLVALIGGTVGGRIDMTAGKLYSLSGATVELLRGLPDPVTIKLYASQQLPPEAETALRDVRDKIVDYQTASGGRVKAVFKQPGNSPEDQQELQENGIQMVQFNVVRQDEYQVKQGFLGLAVEYRNQRETIPFVNRVDDLEYKLSAMIRKLAAPKRKKVAFLTGLEGAGHGGGQGEEQGNTYDSWKNQLKEEYNVEELKLEPGKQVPSDVSVLVIAGPRSDAGPKRIAAIRSFLERGGSVLALLDALDINDKMMYVLPHRNDLIDLAADYGMKVRPQLLFDLRANQPITAGSEGNHFLLPYPFWMRVSPAADNTVVGDIQAITVPWGQPITIDRKKGKGVEPLLATSRYAGVQTKDFSILPRPDMQVNPNDLRSYVVAAARTTKGGGRLVVVGDSDLLKDRFLAAGQSDNGVFGLNVVDWLAQDAALSEIRSKKPQSRLLVFPTEAVRDGVRYFNLILMPVLVALYGVFRLNRRRRLTRKAYAS